MPKPKFLDNLHESDVETLHKAATDAGLDKDLIIQEKAADRFGNRLFGYVSVFTSAPWKDHQLLWRRYEFHHAWKDSNVDSEIDSLTKPFPYSKK
jgi:hypothetical protein